MKSSVVPSSQVALTGSSNQLSIPINLQTGTSYTLQASDNGGVVKCTNASAITVTVPSGLGAGFNCTIIQGGAGQVSLSASGTTLKNRQSQTKTNAQEAAISLFATIADTLHVIGDTGA